MRANICIVNHCPFACEGSFPYCKCPGDRTDRCPWNSIGSYGNCTCNGDLTYDKVENRCGKCPGNR